MYVFGQTTSLLSPCLRFYFMDAFLTVQYYLSISWFSSCLFSMDATSSQGLVLLLFFKFDFLLIAYFSHHYFTMENIKSRVWDLGSLIMKFLLTLIKSELQETVKANLINQKQSRLGQEEIWQKLETKWFSMSTEDFNTDLFYFVQVYNFYM